MRLRIPYIFYLFTEFLCFHLPGFSQDIHFSLIDRPIEQRIGIVLGMEEDKQGFLWMATGTGLYKYDGYQYISFQHQPKNPNSIANDNNECIKIDRAGYVWLGPRGAGLDRLDPETGVVVHFRHHMNDSGSLVNDTVNAIIEDHDGDLWIGTKAGLEKFELKTNHFIHYRHITNDESSLSYNEVRTLYEDKQGTIWVGTGTAFIDNSEHFGGLNKLNKKTGKFTRFLHDEKDPNSLIDNRVRAIFEDSRGVFWVGTAGDGLHTMDRSKGKFKRHLFDPFHPDQLSRPPLRKTGNYADDHITFIIEDAKQKIWIGTYLGGINIYDPVEQKVTYYGADKNSKEKLEDDHFWTAYRTRDNTTWVSTWDGNLYKVNSFQKILNHVRIGKQVIGFAEDEENGLWIASQNSLIHKDNNSKEEEYLINKDGRSRSDTFYYIVENHGKFWAGTGRGLYQFDPKTKSYSGFHLNSGASNDQNADTATFIYEDFDNRLWIGTFNGLLVKDARKGPSKLFQNNINDTESISNNLIFAIAADKAQNLWFGTQSGLNRLNRQKGKFKRYLPGATVVGIVSDKAGNLWVATSLGFLEYDWKADDFFAFTDESSRIFPTTGPWIMEDHQKNLWFSSIKGIVKLNEERGIAVLYGKNQGVNGLSLSTGFIRKNGAILFGDTSGYFEFQPDDLGKGVSPPIASINNFSLNNIPVRPSSGGILSNPLMETKLIRLNHDQNTLSFEIANIDFVSQHEDRHLLFMMQNYDNGWRNAGDEKKAYYFNLPPGNFTFRVKAINAFGIEQEKAIDIFIRPPWWTAWWAIAILILLAASSIWAFIAYRSRKLKLENKVLEEKVDHRTSQLNKSLENLKATQTQLIQSEKMASLGELTAGIAHEIQNPLNFVNNFSEVNTELIDEAGREISAGNFEEAKTILNSIKSNEQKIIHHGKRADGIVKSMLQHSPSRIGIKEMVDINSLAEEYLKLSYQGFRSKDKSFHATLKTDFDKNISELNAVPQDIARVLINLFNNAFYSVGEKSRVRKEYKPTVQLSTKKTGNRIELHVRDNGNGIHSKIVDKIIQPFFTTKPAGEGTGLGLSLSYDIIKAHGGELKIESVEGEFAEFILILPVEPQIV